MSTERICEYCGGEIGFKMFLAPDEAPQPVFCCVLHMNLWFMQKTRQERKESYTKQWAK